MDDGAGKAVGAADGEASAWLRLLPADALLIGSCPTVMSPLLTGGEGAVMPASRVRLQQVLFGFEAQLRAFAQGMRREGRWLRFTPMPEMFATARSLAALAAAVPTADAGREIVHVRFGPARFARVLKGARNVMVAADDAVHFPVDRGLSEVGQDNRLPAPFGEVLVYGARRGALSRIGGGAVREAVLPAALVHADLDVECVVEDDAALRSVPWWARVAGLRVRSLAELSRGDWFSDDDDAGAADWRGALARGAAGRLIMVPWNLAYGGSVVPDLVVKLAHRQRLAAARAWIVLFPFNAVPSSQVEVGARLAEIRDAVGADNASLRRIFCARLSGLADAGLLRRLFPVAWLEADDPEVVFTAGRLAHLGVQFCLIGESPAVLRHRAVRCVAPDEPVRVRVADMFGERIYAGRSLSVRKLGELLVEGLTGDE